MSKTVFIKSEEQKEKHRNMLIALNKSRIGTKQSQQQKLKRSKSLLGHNVTEETRKKISISNTGDKNAQWRGGKPKCISCTKEIAHKAIRCRKCFDKIRIGDKCSSWKGGITSKNDKDRSSLEIKLWKKSCLERDNFTCQKTGQKGGRLNVHHINNFADFPELRFAIDNGITLSKEEHIEFHKKYGKRNNTREQLEDFLNSNYNVISKRET